MVHWTEAYIGRPHVTGSDDCARLFYDVSRDVFHTAVPEVDAVERAASRLGRCAQVADAVDAYCVSVDDPVDGDAVLMWSLGRPSHIGVFCLINGERCVLHSIQSAGMVVLHRLRDLPRIPMGVEGFYRWK